MNEESKQAQEIRQRTEEYRVLHEVAQVLHRSGNLKEMLKSAMNVLTQFKELEVELKAGVFLADEENKKLKLCATVGKFSDEFMEKEKEIPYGNCLCGRAAVSGELIVSNSCFTDERHDNIFEDMTDHGHYIVPLKSQQQLVGILFLYTDANPPWYVRSETILLSIGGLIGDAIKSYEDAEKIREQNEQLIELNALKNKFLGIASHDLRNPLYLIRSFSEILKDESIGKVTEKQKELLEKIFNASTFMKALLENLLDISKIESGKIELNKTDQDLNILVKQQLEISQLLAEKKAIKLILELGEIPKIKFDANAITQVVGNFIGNAIKFSPSDTNVFISTSNLGDNVLMSVRDEGPGISDEDQKLLFKEFQTLSAKPTGGEKSTGLGLAITQKLINAHEGKIGVESKLGSGSTFFFSLPL